MSINNKIIKHLAILTTLMVVSLVSILIIVVNLESNDKKSFVSSEKSPPTYSPFVKMANDKFAPRNEVEFEKALNKVERKDTNLHVIRTSSDFNRDIPYEVDEKAGKIYKKVYTGNRINIIITGVDSRLGSRYKHGDANHVLSILLDSGKIEITSIPRDTKTGIEYEVEDSTKEYTLSVLRAKEGRQEYIKKAAKIAELDKIHYWIEIGFSQAIGILDWLGYENSDNALQVLRSRKVFEGGDWQRTYNQGQFIKQSILKSYNNYNGLFGDIVLTAILGLLETNITVSESKSIMQKLRSNGFGNKEDVHVRIRPEYKLKYKKYDFTNSDIITQLEDRVESESKLNGQESDSKISPSSYVKLELDEAIDKAISDSTKPWKVIHGLRTYYKQRAWLQIKDKQSRHYFRDKIKVLLSRAYIKSNKTDKAKEVIKTIENEDKLYLYNLNKAEKLDGVK